MRRRIASFVLLAAMSTALVIAAWFVMRTSERPTAAQPGLTLLVNLRSRLEMTPGTPLIFDVSLSSSPSAPAIAIGSRWSPWQSLIRLEAAGNASLPWPTTQSARRSVHVRPAANGSSELKEDTSVVAHLEAGRDVHTVTFTTRPDETAAIAPGIYGVRAVLQTPWWLRWGWTGRAVSGIVTVLVRDPSRADDRTHVLEEERLARSANFYVNASRYGDALEAAVSLVASKPRESRSHMLLGDSLAGLDRQQEALDAYHRAMALLRPSYEKPTVLLERIRSVETQRVPIGRGAPPR